MRYIHTIIGRALREAVAWDRIPRNVAQAAQPPGAAQAKSPRDENLGRIEIDCATRGPRSTSCLEAGVDVKIVSERLGHASAKITWDIYQHVTPTMQADAAETVARLIFGTDA